MKDHHKGLKQGYMPCDLAPLSQLMSVICRVTVHVRDDIIRAIAAAVALKLFKLMRFIGDRFVTAHQLKRAGWNPRVEPVVRLYPPSGREAHRLAVSVAPKQGCRGHA